MMKSLAQLLLLACAAAPLLAPPASAMGCLAPTSCDGLVDSPINPACTDHAAHDHADETWTNLDLDGTCLFFADLDDVSASCADPTAEDCNNLENANLNFATIRDAAFQYANFGDASLFDADLDRSDFTGAIFISAVLQDADLSGGVFDGAFFEGADMRFVDALCVLNPDVPAGGGDDQLLCPSFRGSRFHAADLSLARIFSADLTNAIFEDAVLDGASLLYALADCEDPGTGTPTCVSFAGASLVDANLSGGDFDGASFVGADLTSARAICLIDITPGADPEDRDCASFVEARFAPPAPGPDPAVLSSADFTGAILAGAAFTNVRLDEAILREAVLHQEVSGADLCASFTNATLKGIDLSVVDFEDMPQNVFQGIAQDQLDPRGPDLSEARFVSALLSGLDLSGVDLTDAVLDAAFLEGTNLDGADLTGASLNLLDLTEPCGSFNSACGSNAVESCTNFSNIVLVDASVQSAIIRGLASDYISFAGAIIDGTRFDASELGQVDFTGAQFNCRPETGCGTSGDDETPTSFLGATIDGVLFDGADLRNIDFSFMVFTGSCDDDTCIRMDGAQIRGASFRFVDFDVTDVSNDILKNVATTDVCKVAATTCPDLREVDLRSADLTSLDMASANLSGADLGGTTLDDTILTDALFSDDDIETGAADLSFALARCTSASNPATCPDWSGAVLRDVTLDSATITGANLTDVDFTNATLLCNTVDEAPACTSLSGSNLLGAIFTDAALEGVILSNIDFSDLDADIFDDIQNVPDTALANLRSSDFTSAVVWKLDLDAFDLSDARFSSAQLCNDDATPTCLTLRGGTLLEGAIFSAVDFDGVAATFFDDIAASPAMMPDLRSVDFSQADISELQLGATDLEGAVFTGSQICTDTASCSAQEQYFAGARLDGAAFESYDFGDFPPTFLSNAMSLAGIDLSSAILDDLNLAGPFTPPAEPPGLDLTGADLSGARLLRTNLQNSDLTSARLDGLNTSFFDQPCDDNCPNFTGVKLGGASLRQVDFTRIAILDEIDPDLTPPEGEVTDFTSANLSGLTDIFGLILVDARFTSSTLDGIDFTGFDDVDFFRKLAPASDPDEGEERSDFTPSVAGASFDQATISSSSLPMDLTTVDFTEANLDEASLDNAIMGCGSESDPTQACTDFTGARLRATSFDNATMLEARLHAVNASDPCIEGVCISFVDAVLGTPVDETDDDATGVSLIDSNLENLADEAPGAFQLIWDGSLRRAVLTGANLQGFDLSGLVLAEIEAGTTLSLFCNAEGDTANERDCADLTLVDFTQARLSQVHLGGAALAGANFTDADLSFGDLSGLLDEIDGPCDEVLVGGELVEGVLVGAVSSCVDFTRTKLDGIAMSDTDLSKLGSDVFANIAKVDEDDPDSPPALRAALFLDGSNLTGIDLSGFDLQSSIFRDSNLTDANLSQANVTNLGSFCDFDAGGGGLSNCSNLTRIDLSGVELNGIDFRGVELTGASLRGTVLRFAIFDGFSETCLEEGTPCFDLRGADMSGSSWRNVDFTTFDPERVDLSDRGLSGILFDDSDLTHLSLMGSDLSYTTLTGAILAGANLSNTSFDFANFSGGLAGGCGPFVGTAADFTGANLTGAKLAKAATFQDGCIEVDRGTFYSAETTFPAGFTLLDQMTKIVPSNLAGQDLSGGSFAGMDLEGFDFSASDLSGVTFWNTKLAGSQFAGANFAGAGAANVATSCNDYDGPRADFRRADLSGADLSNALTFQTDCVRVDATTRYTNSTQFPPGFDALEAIPEPGARWLQIASLAALAAVVRMRRGRRA